MKKERYSIFLTGTIPQTAGIANSFLSFTQSFNFDMRTLIPLKYLNEKFLIHTAFFSSASASTIGGLDINLLIPNNYNKSITNDGYITIGTAFPINQQGNGTSIVFVCNPNTSIPIMIDYPDLTSIQIEITTKTTNQAVASALNYSLHLIFELL